MNEHVELNRYYKEFHERYKSNDYLQEIERQYLRYDFYYKENDIFRMLVVYFEQINDMTIKLAIEKAAFMSAFDGSIDEANHRVNKYVFNYDPFDET